MQRVPKLRAGAPRDHVPMIPGTAILWDIDGTLLRAKGSGVTAFAAALAAVVDKPYPIDAIDMGGCTDPFIARSLLTAVGIHDHSHVPALLDAVAAHYAANEQAFRTITEVKPGIPAALRQFDELAVTQTLVTGNLQSVATLKVTAADLHHHLQIDHGGYGSDHEVRAELVRISCARLAAAGLGAAPERTWVIGDTPRDLQAAREAGVRCILVATGNCTFDELQPLGADAVFADLKDLDRLLDLVMGA